MSTRDPMADFEADAQETQGKDPGGLEAKPSEQTAAVPEKPTERVAAPRSTGPLFDRKTLGLAVVGGIVLIGVVVVVVVSKRKGEEVIPESARINSAYDTTADVDAKFARFMDAMKKEVPESRRKAEEALKQIGEIKKSLESELDKARKEREIQNAALDTNIRDLLKKIEGAAPSTTGAAVASGDLAGFVGVLRKQRAGTGLGLDEARIRLENYLNQQGFKDANLRLLRDRSLDQLGFLYVGDVQEPELSAAELEELPEKLRPLTKKLADENFAAGNFSGKVLYREEEGLKWLANELGEKKVAEYSLETRRKAVFLARIRKANATKEMEEMLPELAALRDKEQIAPSDLFRTEAFIWRQSKRWPGINPGQQLSLVFALAGIRGNGSGDLISKKVEATPDLLSLVEGAVRDALQLALSQGTRDQAKLLERGRNAAFAKVADLRLNMTANEQERLVIAQLSALLKSSSPASAAATSTASTGGETSTSDAPAPRVVTSPAAARLVDQGLSLGPVHLRQEKAALDATFVAVMVAQRLKLDPAQPEGMAGISALLAAAPELGKASWIARHDAGEGLAEFTDGLIGDFQEVLDRSRSVLSMPVVVKDLPPAQAALFQAAILGRAIGLSQGSDRSVTIATVKRRYEELSASPAAPRIAAPDSASGWGLVVFLGRQIGTTVDGSDLTRLPLLAQILSRQDEERRVAIEQVQLADKTLREKTVRATKDGLIAVLPALLAQIDDGRAPEPVLTKAVAKGANRFAVASIAEAVLGARGINEVVQRFAALLDHEKMLSQLYLAMAQWTPTAIHGLLESARPEITDTNIGSLAQEIANRLADDLVQHLAKTVIRLNLTPRIEESAGSLGAGHVPAVLAFIDRRLGEAAIDPLTVARIDVFTQQLHRESLDELARLSQGKAGAMPAGKESTRAPVTPSGKTGFFEVKDEGLPGQPIGVRSKDSGQRVRVLPQGSEMRGFLDIGCVIGIKTNDNIDRVQVRCRGGFLSPSGRWHAFPVAILQGTIKPNVGGDRINIDLSRMTFDLPNKRTVTKEVAAIVTDIIDGTGGAIAKYENHDDKVLPAAAEIGVLQGAADAIRASAVSTTVTTQGTVVQQTGGQDALLTGAGNGIAAGVDLIHDYRKSYLDKLTPTLSSPNGQPLVIHFFTTVEFPEVSDEDWRSFYASTEHTGDGF